MKYCRNCRKLEKFGLDEEFQQNTKLFRSLVLENSTITQMKNRKLSVLKHRAMSKIIELQETSEGEKNDKKTFEFYDLEFYILLIFL